MNREKFCATSQYKKLRNELNIQKYILRNLSKDNIIARTSCEDKIKELQDFIRRLYGKSKNIYNINSSYRRNEQYFFKCNNNGRKKAFS